jgi:spore coat-associated protein N
VALKPPGLPPKGGLKDVKKILLSILAIIVALGVIGGAFAYFQDTETSSGNTFTAGTMDLKLTDNNETTPVDGVHVTWSMTNMAPGITGSGLYGVTLYNTGTIEADHVEISFSHEIIDTPDVESDTNPSSLPGDLARWIQINTMGYDGLVDDFTVLFAGNMGLYDSNGNGFFDLEDLTMSPWSDEGGPLDNLPPPGANSSYTRSLQMNLKFNAGATDDIQGDTLITTVTFTLNQDADQ